MAVGRQPARPGSNVSRRGAGTVREVAARLGVSRDWVRHLVAAGCPHYQSLRLDAERWGA